jgi:transcriptional regulator with XRE-family HTH domain
METLGTRLRVARRARHLSQEAVARAAGISLGHYQRLEADKHSPNWLTIQALAHALGVPITTLTAKSDKNGQDSHSYPDDHDHFPRAS